MNDYKKIFTLILSEVDSREGRLLIDLYTMIENMVREIVKEELDNWQNDIQFKINLIMKDDLYKEIERALKK